MSRAAAVLTVLLGATGVSQAEDSPLADQTRTAHEAAVRGNCEDVLTIAGHVWAVDPNYYTETFLPDAAINACLVPQPPVAQPAQRDVLQPPSQTAVVSTPSTQPPLSVGRVAGELIVGGATSVVGGFVGAVIGASLEDCHGDEDFCGLGGALVGGSIGLTIGAPLGVYLVGNAGSQTGSAGATFGCAALGFAVSLAVVRSSNREPSTALGVMLLAMPTIGATLGFNLTRRYDHVTVAPVATNQTIGLAGTF